MDTRRVPCEIDYCRCCERAMRFRGMQSHLSSKGIRDSSHDEIWSRSRYRKAICLGNGHSRRAFPPSRSACATRSFTNPLPCCLFLSFSLSRSHPLFSSTLSSPPFSLLSLSTPSPLCILYLARAYLQRHPHPHRPPSIHPSVCFSIPFLLHPLVNPGDVQLLGKVRVRPRH